MRPLTLCALCALWLLAACESDTTKAARLKQNMLAECAGVRPPLSGVTITPQKEAKCDVATREYTKFMSGR